MLMLQIYIYFASGGSFLQCGAFSVPRKYLFMIIVFKIFCVPGFTFHHVFIFYSTFKKISPSQNDITFRKCHNAGLLGRVPLSSVCSFAHLNLFFLLASLRYGFSLQLCLEGQHPGVSSSLLTLRLMFCMLYLMKLPVEDV